MEYYQEITLINSFKGSLFKLWSKVFMQVHLALVEQAKKTYGDDAKVSGIGVSFPEYQQFEKNGRKFSILGSKLRVFTKQKTELEHLDLQQKLSQLNDYVHIKSVSIIPKQIKGHLTVNRYRQDRNMERLTRRYAKRKNISFEEAKSKQVSNYAEKNNISFEKAMASYESPHQKKLPYIIMDSLSSNNKFSLEIAQCVTDRSHEGLFNTYGMSAKTTVPNW